jgi:predicted O-methyltransferase YrrM
MRSHFRALSELSLEKAWRLVSQPGMVPVWLTAPREASSSVDALTMLLAHVAPDEAAARRLEFLRDHRFFAELNARLVEGRHRRTTCEGWHELLYLLVRFMRPRVVLETGVFDGQSSAVILLGLAANDDGMLVSIDLPALTTMSGSTDRMYNTALPPAYEPGWVVPDYLRDRYRLILGDSRMLLPGVLDEYGSIDVFLHDSLHTFDHQYFEYSTAWPRLAAGGLLLSDDIFWNPAFHRFAAEVGRPYVRFQGFGAVQKLPARRCAIPAVTRRRATA